MTLALRGHQLKCRARSLLYLRFAIARDIEAAAAGWPLKREGRKDQRSSRPQNALDLLEISLLLCSITNEVKYSTIVTDVISLRLQLGPQKILDQPMYF